jgi:hypothetical protein
MKPGISTLFADEPNDLGVREELSQRYCRRWAVAPKEFREELKRAFAERAASRNPEGTEWADVRQAQWERLLASLMKAAGKPDKNAKCAPKSAPWKIKIARELRTRSTATNAWIADRLARGYPTRVCNLIARNM